MNANDSASNSGLMALLVLITLAFVPALLWLSWLNGEGSGAGGLSAGAGRRR